ncbi:hypothetical protein JR316_0009207 [Psilocybe cubensis]|uniref:Uncharacterized protein n=2 Tax=Psilocybe cubensis TaxID=181762 RepID=A0ACB8GTJ0_PSICU|nr:hypothetical protein JR316_0009207 [Psilocybe cubensis]KAH9478747.1 hypothetical protein JR316_0009207 [Psilocybe cubensis]
MSSIINQVSETKDPREQLAIIEAEVARVSATLVGLMNESISLKRTVNDQYSPFLLHLPVEIISEIFSFCLPSFDPKNDMPSTGDPPFTPFVFGAVCASWRRIAWSTPMLWSKLTFRLISPLNIHTQVNLLEEWLARSGELPLSIRLMAADDFSWTGVSSEGVIQAIRKYAHRWHDLIIHLPSSCYRYLPSTEEARGFPVLNSFILKPPGGQGDRVHRITIPLSPNLRYLSLSCLYLRSIVFHFEVLTHVELESFYIDEILEMLRQTTALHTLTAKRILSGDDRHDPPEEPIILSNLEEVCIVNDKGTDIQLLFDKISTPKLNTLSYTAEGLQPVPAHDIVSLIKRSGCQLETLDILHAPIREEPLQILLAALSSLKSLKMAMPTLTSIRHAPLTDAVLQTLNPDYAQANKISCSLPELQSLSYAGAQGFTWEALLTVLESRCPLPPPKDPSQLAPVISSHKPMSSIKDVMLVLNFASPDEHSSTPSPCPIMLESLAHRGVSISIRSDVRPGLHALVEEA